MLERTHLAIIREVDRHGSLTAAAGVLCLTQSALSHTVKKMERQLGTAVWSRDGRNLRLTQAGQYLLALANRVLPPLLPVAAQGGIALPRPLARRGCRRQTEIPVWRHWRVVRL